MNKTLLPLDIQDAILNATKPLNPYKVILFGSYAYGQPRKDSDIDFYIVTNDEYMPNSFEEKSRLYSQFSRALDFLYETIPLDIIVHTKSMYEKFKELNSSFSRQILTLVFAFLGVYNA